MTKTDMTSYKIQGTENIQNATIASTNKVCEQNLGHALKSNTLVCSLRAGYNGVRISITRNVHISRFISTLNKIKNITGLYIIVEASSYDWLEYASGNTTYENLYVIPNKISIIPTINTHLDDLWQN